MAATVGEAILSASFQVILEKLSSPILSEFGFKWDVDKDLRKLGRTFSKFQTVLNEAEIKQTRDIAVKMWLNDLKYLAYDAEDVVDEYVTEVQRQKLEEEIRTDPTQVWKPIPPPLSPNAVSFRTGIAYKIKEVVEKLDELAKEMDDLGLKEGVGGRSTEFQPKARFQTTSLVVESSVYGRESDKNNLIKLLLNDGSSRNEVFDVIPIVGMSGVGKTTLAQLVYNDERVQTNFELRAWVCVSEEVDLGKITKAILESVARTSCNLKDLEPLQCILKEILNGKRFLLVLDDVWNENHNEWDVLRIPFTFGKQGSKIIVTTQSKKVSSVMSMNPFHHYDLEGLSNEDCLLLLRERTFTGRDSNAHPNLEAVVKEIVKKCKGLPTTAKTLGALLHSKACEEEWRDILTTEIWDIPQDKNDILLPLRLSYQHLPAHLKRCFAYCSIFPKGYVFDKEGLILLWIAEGFVYSTGRKQLEDIGSEYFDDLFLRSFFQHSNSNKSQYVMHDLVHDLAQSISREMCFRLEGDNSCNISEKARHASLLQVRVASKPIKFDAFDVAKSLRTFLLHDPYSTDRLYIQQQLPGIFRALTCLRVLCLSSRHIIELPYSIGNLKQLRYLDLSLTRIKRLPESMSSLCNLQTLILGDCEHLLELPRNLYGLINLRHIKMIRSSKIEKMPYGIGRLTSLQTLSHFVVGENSGSSIGELKNMLHLRGELCISRLENVVNFMDAKGANFKNKQHLRRLELKWSYRKEVSFFLGSSQEEDVGSPEQRVEEEIIECLHPHTNLEELLIESYFGIRFPSWIAVLSNLVKLKLDRCERCEALPSLGQLPLLKHLDINRMNSVKCIGREFCGDDIVKGFPSLATLVFKHMSGWREWSRGAEESEKEFPNLRELIIQYCPKLKGFSSSFQFHALEKLEVRGCGELTSIPRQRIMLVGISDSDFEVLVAGEEKFPCLEHLSLWDCLKLRKLPQLLPSLIHLYIRNCPELAILPYLPSLTWFSLEECDEKILTELPDLHSLSYLHLSKISNLSFLPNGFLQPLAKLETLEIYSCDDLMALGNEVGMHNLTFLQRLVIVNCPKLVSLIEEEGEGLPTTIQHLELRNCLNLKCLPHGLHHLSCLVVLEIENAPRLVSFPEMGLPRRLQRLRISTCRKLKSLPKGLYNLSSLENLEIRSCPCLMSFPDRDEEDRAPTTLKSISIEECANLKSLPKRMHKLTSLEDLKIKECPQLENFPEEGLPNTIKSLVISYCENLLPKGCLRRLTSLQHLFLAGCPGLVSFPEEDWLLSNTLEYLSLSQCENLESLRSRGMYNLNSLESLYINDAPKLSTLPTEGLPTTLHYLGIDACPLLTKSCLKHQGRDWPKIAHIPNICFDGEFIT